MTKLYPLRFRPLFRRAIWGGRRLATMLDKPLGPEPDFAESWEIVDHGQDQSVVAAGPLAGTPLGELVQQHRTDLLGPSAKPFSRFPLLFKFLDAHQKLSVQVHPDDRQASQLTPPDLGKTEAWVILHADPGSVVYCGLKRGFDRGAFERELHRGTTELCLHRIEPRVGDCLFIPAGTVHALGAGLVIAEVQQSSDTTFRLFDWNRVGPDGQPRPLHVAQALDVIRYDFDPVYPQVAQSTERSQVERLVACDQFVWDRWQWRGGTTIGGDDRFHLLCVLEGEVRVEGDFADEPLRRGQTMLIPASAGRRQLEAADECVMLDAYV